MDEREERDGREEAIEAFPESKRVRLRLNSRHILPDPSLAGRMASLFGGSGFPAEPEDEEWSEDDPENWPDEMEDALAELSAMEGVPIPGEEFPPREPEESEGSFGNPMSGNVSIHARNLGREQLEQLLEALTGEDEGDFYVFETEAVMSRERQPDGTDNLELSYREDESMDDTVTTVLLNTGCPGLVTIYRSGDVINTLICEAGRRHISAYETPIAPFEMAVYTRTCEGGITFEGGGTIDLDYLVELRGMEVQRTRMRIEVEVPAARAADAE